MERSYFLRVRFWLFCAVVLIAVVGVGCCDCDCGGDGGNGGSSQADHWLVIHDKVQTVSADGGPWSACIPELDDDNLDYLPKCMDVDKGETIGFANYSDTDVEIRHFNSLDAPSDPFILVKGDSTVFTVTVEGQRPQFEIKSDSSMDHGGPEMIIRP
jgi:hypothetical protein